MNGVSEEINLSGISCHDSRQILNITSHLTTTDSAYTQYQDSLRSSDIVALRDDMRSELTGIAAPAENKTVIKTSAQSERQKNINKSLSLINE